MRILAIESSHDDTSVVIYENKQILHDFSFSQVALFAKYGGTIPELASRYHAQNFDTILLKILELNFDFSTLDHIAYTSEPGLIGSLQMGKIFAQALGLFFGKKVFPINHMHAHIFAIGFEHQIQYPALALIASGGHTQLWLVKSPKQLKIVGMTLDDAAGEAFDKVARAMHLPMPGGPSIEKLALTASKNFAFDIIYQSDLNFSFSGLKTKVLQVIGKHDASDFPQIAKGFQDEVIKQLIFKTSLAIKKYHPHALILGGGVAANEQLREEFQKFHKQCVVLIPSKKFTTDNAAMIAIMSEYLQLHSA